MRVKARIAYFYRMQDGKEPAREWLDCLKDKVGLAKIFTRIRRAEIGDFGDSKNLGDGVGDKSIQARNLRRAKHYWKDYKRRHK